MDSSGVLVSADSQAELDSSLLGQTVCVQKLLDSRYPDNVRPSDWDVRVAGQDRIVTTDGVELALWSSGMQSPPKPGWILLIREGMDEGGYAWTLYGIRRA